MNLIKASEGNKKSQIKMKKLRGNYSKTQCELYASNIFIENKYVVPSNSKLNYENEMVSHKGATLLDLTKQGFSVPDFCILTKKGYLLKPEKRLKHLKSGIKNLEMLTGKKLGNECKPLIFAMRCALSEYVPGLMPTYLNVGVTEKIFTTLKNIYGIEIANKIYLNNLRTIYKILYPDDIIEHKDNKNEINYDQFSNERSIKYYYDKIVIKDFKLLTDAFYQYIFFVNTIADFYNKNQDLIFTFQKKENTYPSIILQKMVWTVGSENSYPGVLYSRHSRTGLGVQVESFNNIFGEEIMSGLINTEHTEFFDKKEIKNKFPAIYHFYPNIFLLEKQTRSPVSIEFAAESFNDTHFFAVLQLDKAELSGRATLLSAIDLYKKNTITKKEVLELVRPYHLRQIFSERIDENSLKKLQFFSKGISILPRSAVSARIFFSASIANKIKNKNDKICHCKSRFTPMNRVVMREADAILSMTPAAIHVVTACLGYGIPAFINIEKYGVQIIGNTLVNKKGVIIKEGDWITISSKRRNLYIGKADYTPARFQKYLEGKKLIMDTKEETVFINMQTAYKAYQQIVKSLETGDITDLSDLVKLIRNDMNKMPEKAGAFVNNWFDEHKNHYIQQILKSELGSHLDQNRIYNLLSTDRRIVFYKKIISICKKKKIKGYRAGAFMLGRFMSQIHSIAFWSGLNSSEIIFLINEYVLFEKYLLILNEFDEKNINRIRNKILNHGLGCIDFSTSDVKLFTTLKLSVKNVNSIIDLYDSDYDSETKEILTLLKLPFGELYNYNYEWSIDQLKIICKNENIDLPSEDCS